MMLTSPLTVIMVQHISLELKLMKSMETQSLMVISWPTKVHMIQTTHMMEQQLQATHSQFTLIQMETNQLKRLDTFQNCSLQWRLKKFQIMWLRMTTLDSSLMNLFTTGELTSDQPLTPTIGSRLKTSCQLSLKIQQQTELMWTIH